jgi:hypothetical protein
MRRIDQAQERWVWSIVCFGAPRRRCFQGGFLTWTLVAYRDTAVFFVQEEIAAPLVVIDGAHAKACDPRVVQRRGLNQSPLRCGIDDGELALQ